MYIVPEIVAWNINFSLPHFLTISCNLALLQLQVTSNQQVTTDAFTFPEEILKRNTSLLWVLAESKEMK